MGRLFVEELPVTTVYSCKTCTLRKASPEDIVSKDFHGRKGQAFLFNSVVNVVLGPDEDRSFVTSDYTVKDVYCTQCLQLLGWKYVQAKEESQKYKEGKYVLEKSLITMMFEDIDLIYSC